MVKFEGFGFILCVRKVEVKQLTHQSQTHVVQLMLPFQCCCRLVRAQRETYLLPMNTLVLTHRWLAHDPMGVYAYDV
jgi:hypothetical protein